MDYYFKNRYVISQLKINSTNARKNSPKCHFSPSKKTLLDLIQGTIAILTQRMGTQIFLEKFFIMFTDRDINFTIKNNPAMFNSGYFFQINNI